MLCVFSFLLCLETPPCLSYSLLCLLCTLQAFLVFLGDGCRNPDLLSLHTSCALTSLHCTMILESVCLTNKHRAVVCMYQRHNEMSEYMFLICKEYQQTYEISC